MRETNTLADVLQTQLDSGTKDMAGLAPIVGGGKDIGPASTNGSGFRLDRLDPYSVVAKITWNIKTTSLTFTAVWQVSLDGSTWVDLLAPNNGANTAFATGSGADVAGGPIYVSAPGGLAAFPHVRMAVRSAAGTGVTAHDNVDISYFGCLKSRIAE